MTQDFRTALVKFVSETAQNVILDEFTRLGYSNPPKLTITEGRKFTKIIREESNGGQKSVFCFVDNETGDILKPASWKVPAKHPRGNILNPDNGREAVTPWGIRYLK